MSHEDQLVRFNFDDLDIRGELVYLNESWSQILLRHDYPPNVRTQLGEALAALVLLSATIKYDGNMILQVQGSGPLQKLVVQVTHDGQVRGLARWQGFVPAGRLPQVYGEGRIIITIFKASGEQYQSIVAMEGSTLADALNVYFHQSEQLPSTFRLFSTSTRIAGLFLQQLPDSRSTKERLLSEGAAVPGLPRDRLEDWNRVNILASTVDMSELLMLPPEHLLLRLFHEERVSLHAPKPIRFSCTCSRRKVEDTLIALGQAELQDVLRTEGKIEVDCEFCQQRYSLGAADVGRLFTVDPDATAPPPGTVLH